MGNKIRGWVPRIQRLQSCLRSCVLQLKPNKIIDLTLNAVVKLGVGYTLAAFDTAHGLLLEGVQFEGIPKGFGV